MPVMRDIKMSLATAVAAAGISLFSGQALAQDATADNTADNDKITLTQAVASTADSIPATSLKFRRAKIGDQTVEITPDIVKEYARKGRVLPPVAREEQVYPMDQFVNYVRRSQQHLAGIFIGVVVDDTKQPYRPQLPGYTGRDYFRAVKKKGCRIGNRLSGSRKD